MLQMQSTKKKLMSQDNLPNPTPQDQEALAAALPQPRRGFPWALLAKAAVTAALAWIIIAKVDIDAVAARFRTIDGLWLALALLATLTQYALFFLRWHLILKAIETPLPLGKVVQYAVIGLFFNQALPSSIGGDALRIWRAYGAGVPLAKAASSVLLDRALGFTALFLIAAIALPTAFHLFTDPWLQWALPLFIAGALFAIFLMLIFDRLVPAFLRAKRPWRWLIGLAEDGRSVLLHPPMLGAMVIVGLLASLFTIASSYCLARALGIEVGFMVFLILIPLLLTLVTIPISLAGWGLREGIAIFLFGFVGVAESDALSLSVLMGLTAALLSLPGGAVWLATREKNQPARRR